MKKTNAISLLILVTCIMPLPCFGEDAKPDKGNEYRSPDVFEKAIQAFEAKDKQQFPPKDAVVCIGSSSMRGWHGTIREDLSPLTLIPRGFGGSNMNDALYFARRIVLPYKPRAIVVYEGDNDIAQGIAPRMIANTFRKFVKAIHKDLPHCRIYFLSIKPSISRWSMWPKMTKANGLIAEACARDQRLTYLDIASCMLGEDGKPKPDIFKKDKLHMTRAGYVLWRDAVRPFLVAAELPYESRKDADAGEDPQRRRGR